MSSEAGNMRFLIPTEKLIMPSNLLKFQKKSQNFWKKTSKILSIWKKKIAKVSKFWEKNCRNLIILANVMLLLI